ncbi:5-dehydro-4-deoxyglucarate dehydratase [Streptomyces sp. NPDC058989]|uniref:5-dehydro-4-deoxyglucarate dehydratase n=1 Tax=Streptomyces sp. NPDC058989 TaxID=3346686 RepID=UPI00367534BB
MHLDRVLFFPVTPFASDGSVNSEALAAHIEAGIGHDAGGVFVGCGTGEFHALGPEEYRRVVQIAVHTTNGRVPVVAGAGGPLPHAIGCARAAAEAGVDGLLLMPPYLVDGPEVGLIAYVRAVAGATELPVVIYQRKNARFTPEGAAYLAQLPTVAGFKDGLGDIELMQRTVLEVRRALHDSGKPFAFFNGLPTAEVSVPAYRALGVDLYSSAAFCFVPEVANAFRVAVTEGDASLTGKLLEKFYGPLAQLRDRAPGYAVSLVKAGVRLRGLDVGAVRPPLVDPHPKDLDTLERLIATGLDLVQI